ncbi:MAG: hypothetical protein EH225_02090 [Calditrichaeota bacterium]|nr:hypothetical protein [Calditrichota bacterium]RQW07299.1 MAG: hypothetical protein EH225_02090 [Calditrichota bacterium]
MIGGYIYKSEEEKISNRLKDILSNSFNLLQCYNHGFLFYDDNFPAKQTTSYSSENLTVLSQDLLITRDSDGNYTQIQSGNEFAELYRTEKQECLKKIVNDFRLIIVEKNRDDVILHLTSNRAGNGRIYYYQTDSGILFSSDIRFLFQILPFKVNDLALFAILKYGAVPEPLTISEDFFAVPPGKYLHYTFKDSSCRIKPYFQFEFPSDSEKFDETRRDEYLQPAKKVLRKSADFFSQRQSAILLSGGIDSSLYALYLNENYRGSIQGIHCTFGDSDPEFPFARELAEKIDARFLVGKMREENALQILEDTVRLTGHPFSDFSSMPIVYVLKFIKENVRNAEILIEGNGGDDCFGFPDLTSEQKFRIKNIFPGALKTVVSAIFRNSTSWKWESQNQLLSKILALTDVHERSPINYFLVLTPVNFLGLNTYRSWDSRLNDILEDGFSAYNPEGKNLSYQAQVTIRQLIHVNSRRWAAKAYSVGENLGLRVIYPYIWRDVLIEQGKIPWDLKTYNGIVKWPLKRLLEEYMPRDFIYRKKSGFVPPLVKWLTSPRFNGMVRDTLLSTNGNMARLIPSRIIDELLTDALQGKNLRHAILNFLWGAFFTERWIQNQQSP